jgi:hypothetical protein
MNASDSIIISSVIGTVAVLRRAVSSNAEFFVGVPKNTTSRPKADSVTSGSLMLP